VVLALATGLLATGLLGCAGSDERPPQPATAGPLDEGWIAALVEQPERFATTVDAESREGWVAFQQGRYQQAAAALPPGVGQARAWLALAVLEEDLAALSAIAWPMLLTRWQATAPAAVPAPLSALAALALAAAGQEPETLADPAWQGLVAAVLDPSLPDPAQVFDAGGCLLAERQVLAGALDAVPDACQAGQPLDLPGDSRLNDPLLHAALAASYRARAARALGEQDLTALAAKPGGPDLDLLLFGPWWSAADLRADLAVDPSLDVAGAAGPTLAALALPAVPDEDAPQAPRERVRALDQALDAWTAARRATASPDGQALLDELQLVAQVRGQILLAWSREALDQGHPHQATAYVLLAHDVEHARAVGPRNPPRLFALAAEASLRTGRTREALDFMSVLGESHPALRGLIETVGDLAVLEGLGRTGDSKEN